MKYASHLDFLHVLAQNNPGQPEYLQAVGEVMESLWPFLLRSPQYAEHRLLERLAEPDRALIFRVTWVDDSGSLLTLEGGLVGASMALSGGKTASGGARTIERITWTPNRNGQVRQLWESSPDGGKTWTVQFDGLYTRKE